MGEATAPNSSRSRPPCEPPPANTAATAATQPSACLTTDAPSVAMSRLRRARAAVLVPCGTGPKGLHGLAGEEESASRSWTAILAVSETHPAGRSDLPTAAWGAAWVSLPMAHADEGKLSAGKATLALRNVTPPLGSDRQPVGQCWLKAAEWYGASAEKHVGPEG